MIDQENKYRKILDRLAHPGTTIAIYFIIMIGLGALGLLQGENVPAFVCILCSSLFIIYMGANHLRGKLLTHEEKKKEHEFDDWTNSQRGP